MMMIYHPLETTAWFSIYKQKWVSMKCRSNRVFCCCMSCIKCLAAAWNIYIFIFNSTNLPFLFICTTSSIAYGACLSLYRTYCQVRQIFCFQLLQNKEAMSPVYLVRPSLDKILFVLNIIFNHIFSNKPMYFFSRTLLLFEYHSFRK